MKLIIKRDQDKAFMGGMKFILSCRVELTPDEQELIQKYKVHNQPLTYKERKDVSIPSLYIQNLLNGVMYKAKDIEMLLNNEEVIKDACRSFKNFLEVMASFGGEEVVEY